MLGSQTMLAAAAAVVHRHGTQGWLVGGSVRDKELGRFSPDIDLVVTGDAAAMTRDLARVLNLPWFVLSEEHQAYRVVGEVSHVDMAAVRGGGILADLAERDFTINAMALPLEGGELIDPFDGLSDLRARRLRAVSSTIFEADPLRLMRAARFASQLRMKCDTDSLRLVRDRADLLWSAAPERIACEMFMTLDGRPVASAATCWKTLGLFSRLFPDVEGRGGPDWMALSRLEDLILVNAVCPYFPESDVLLLRRLGEPADGTVDRRTALKVARLIWGLNPAEAHRFASRLKLSNSMLSLIETAARMSRWEKDGLTCTPNSGLSTPGPAGFTTRAAVRFLWDASPWEPEMILLAASSGPVYRDDLPFDEVEQPPFAEDRLAPGFNLARRLMALWASREIGGVARLPFNGDDLMKESGVKAGPSVGAALRAAKLAWEAGDVTTREQAMAVARAALAEA